MVCEFLWHPHDVALHWLMLSTNPLAHVLLIKLLLYTWGLTRPMSYTTQRVFTVDLEEEEIVWAIRTGKDFLYNYSTIRCFKAMGSSKRPGDRTRRFGISPSRIYSPRLDHASHMKTRKMERALWFRESCWVFMKSFWIDKLAHRKCFAGCQNLGWKCGFKSNHHKSALKSHDSSYLGRRYRISKACKSQMIGMLKARQICA